jgi:MscS family membrane protein
MRYNFVFLLLVCSVFFLGCSDESENEDSDELKAVMLSTPRQTVKSHITFLQDDNWKPSKSAKTLYDTSITQKKKEELAIKLKEIYDGRGVSINEDEIPNDPNYKDSSGISTYKVSNAKGLGDFAVIKLDDGKWYYSTHTVKKIQPTFKNTYPLGLHKIVYWLSQQSHEQYMGLKAWQYIIIVVLLSICFLLHWGLTYLIDKILVGVFYRFGKRKIANEYILPVAKPISLLFVVAFFRITFPLVQLPPQVNYYLFKILGAGVPLFVTIVLYKLVNVLAFFMERLADRTESTLDDQLVPLIRKALKAFVLLVGLLFILQNLDYNITALLAGLSLGGLAFALAAQDTLKNLFGSIMIFMDRPFQVGDWIMGTGIDGSVEEVGFRTTRVRTFHNSLTSVPNGRIADMTVDNMGKRQYRRYKTMLSLTYDTPPHHLDAFVEGLKKIVKDHPQAVFEKSHIYFTNFGAASLDVLFYIFFEVPTWGDELRSKHEVNLSILKLADELDIRFAFPTQTLHIEDFPEKKSSMPQSYPESKELTDRVAAFSEYRKN